MAVTAFYFVADEGMASSQKNWVVPHPSLTGASVPEGAYT